jgi:hypothetical protein
MTTIEKLIEEFEELKKTKLYASSFKSIDDCIFLAEYSKKEEKRQIICGINYVLMHLDELKAQAIKEVTTLGELYYKMKYEDKKVL